MLRRMVSDGVLIWRLQLCVQVHPTITRGKLVKVEYGRGTLCFDSLKLSNFGI